jgi:hypothetical protein
MTADFIPPLLILVGLAGGLAILIRKSKSLSDDELSRLLGKANLNQRLQTAWQEKVASRFPKEDIEQRLALFAEKFIRRLRIFLTKLDRFLQKLLERVQEARKQKPLDPVYWQNLTNGGKGIGKTLREPARVSLDPFRYETRLRKKTEIETVEYLNVARLYLAQKNFPDARRILLTAWRHNSQERSVWLLLDDIKANEQNESEVTQVDPRESKLPT